MEMPKFMKTKPLPSVQFALREPEGWEQWNWRAYGWAPEGDLRSQAAGLARVTTLARRVLAAEIVRARRARPKGFSSQRRLRKPGQGQYIHGRPV
ncbi:MAG: hypothetical protein HY666_03800 [Chloroflexi bacterium]|nr:hypothetical protein [Chloroflexota bacterium]